MEESGANRTGLSIVVPVLERGAKPVEIQRYIESSLHDLQLDWEVVVVLDGPQDDKAQELIHLFGDERQRVSVIGLSKPLGEAAALTAAFKRARGELIVTVGSHLQVESDGLRKALQAMKQQPADMIVARRHPRRDGVLARLQSKVYHWAVRLLTGTAFHDISCGFRIMRKEVAASLDLYGDLYRFIPVLATSRGFVVREVPVAQYSADRPRGLYGPASYTRRLLDLITLFFLVRFTQRPLRFFGSAGILLSGPGLVITFYLGMYRLLRFGAIADRPLLLLGLLLLVMGAQAISIGLLGELIIFTHSRAEKGYHVVEVMERIAVT